MNLDFPYHFDTNGRTATTNREEHIREMILLLMFTNPGERVNRPEFGSGVQQLVFAPNSPELAAALNYSAQAALQTWLGDIIELEALEVISIDNLLQLSVSYRLRDEQESRTINVEREM